MCRLGCKNKHVHAPVLFAHELNDACFSFDQNGLAWLGLEEEEPIKTWPLHVPVVHAYLVPQTFLFIYYFICNKDNLDDK